MDSTRHPRQFVAILRQYGGSQRQASTLEHVLLLIVSECGDCDAMTGELTLRNEIDQPSTRCRSAAKVFHSLRRQRKEWIILRFYVVSVSDADNDGRYPPIRALSVTREDYRCQYLSQLNLMCQRSRVIKDTAHELSSFTFLESVVLRNSALA